MPIRIQEIAECRACGGRDLLPLLDLGHHPLANSLLDHPNQHEERLPLHLGLCRRCDLAQLLHEVDRDTLFSHYVWVTGTSATARAQAGQFCQAALDRIPPSRPDSYVLEIASNDGTFLRPFQLRGYDVLGIDPAKNIADQANSAGIPTQTAFFDLAIARELTSRRGKPNLVIARNVLAHVGNPRDFVSGLAHLIGDDGLAVLEFQSADRMISDLQYDAIYHEHQCYFSAITAQRLLAQFDLTIVEVDTSPISGGALIIYVRKAGHAVGPRAEATLAREEAGNRVGEQSWRSFCRRVPTHKDEFCRALQQQKADNSLIVGYGASARSSTLLNYCHIGPDLISRIADQNPLKQNRYTAGTHIPIRAPDDVLATHPKAVALLAWNFRPEIEPLLRQRYGFKGPVIVPLPEVEILGS